MSNDSTSELYDILVHHLGVGKAYSLPIDDIHVSVNLYAPVLCYLGTFVSDCLTTSFVRLGCTECRETTTSYEQSGMSLIYCVFLYLVIKITITSIRTNTPSR